MVAAWGVAAVARRAVTAGAVVGVEVTTVARRAVAAGAVVGVEGARGVEG